MKTNVFYLMVFATLLLGLGGCGNDQISPEQENPAPAPTPDDNGMVTLRINVSNPAYEDGVPATRGPERPMTFTQELGEGYVLESTLVPSPATRAVSYLAEGTTLLMIAFDSDNEAVGSELLEVGANGAVEIELPGGTETPKLIFYTRNDDAALTDAEFTGSQLTAMPSSPVAGTYYEASSPVTFSATPRVDLTGFDGAFNTGNRTFTSECMFALLTGVDTGDPDTYGTITFQHPLTKLTWSVVVDASVSETVGQIRAGLLNRGSDFSMNLSNLAALTDLGTLNPGAVGSTTSVESYSEPGNTVFASSGGGVTWTSGTILFAPYGTKPMIYVDTLGINNATTGDALYQNDTIYIKGLADDAFLPGRHYTVTSYLTKRVTWATSNIYWDGSKLTFDADATHGGVAGGIPSVTTVNSPRYQGLLFKWGSLDGISPAGSVYLNLFSYVYVPSTTTAGYNASYSKVRPTTSVWTAIPYIPETLVPADGSVLPRKAILDSGTWYGDICAYITHGVWRMPTKQEYNPGNQTDNIVLVDTEPTGEGWWISNENTWSSVTPDNDEISSSGKFELDPDNMFMLKTKWGQRVALPPVQQTTLGGLGGGFIILPDPGIAGDYWTGSSSLLNDQAAFIRLRAAGDPNGTNFSVDAGRDVACPVRCVK